jgi:hypothetical protein
LFRAQQWKRDTERDLAKSDEVIERAEAELAALETTIERLVLEDVNPDVQHE